MRQKLKFENCVKNIKILDILGMKRTHDRQILIKLFHCEGENIYGYFEVILS
jgi:hypothetical protein